MHVNNAYPAMIISLAISTIVLFIVRYTIKKYLEGVENVFEAKIENLSNKMDDISSRLSKTEESINRMSRISNRVSALEIQMEEIKRDIKELDVIKTEYVKVVTVLKQVQETLTRLENSINDLKKTVDEIKVGYVSKAECKEQREVMRRKSTQYVSPYFTGGTGPQTPINP